MSYTIGTHHFVSRARAIEYYRRMGIGEPAAHVDRRLADGSIRIGKPRVKAGELVTVIDEGCRYAISALCLLLLVAGCDNGEARKANFMANCVKGEFTRAQCVFLEAMAERSASDAQTALAISMAVTSMNAATQAAGRR